MHSDVTSPDEGNVGVMNVSGFVRLTNHQL